MLNKIMTDKREEVEQRKRRLPLSVLKESIAGRKAPLDFARALRGESLRLIAEVKRASPSRGVICPNLDPVAVAKAYARGGAAAISVLTEANYFQGSLDHLTAIRKEVGIPLLRKDFIFDRYQVYESTASGADAILLIAAVLNQEQLAELLSLSRNLGMNCLVEVHREEEMERALAVDGAGIIGINNRDLDTLEVDINTTRRLRPLIPSDRLVVSESGIRNREDTVKLEKWGVNAVLVGEALATADDISAKMKELTSR